MITNKTKLKFGDVIYIVKETNNAFIKKKLTMIDENGIEWYRYDRDNWEYSIEEIVYVGSVELIVKGEVDDTRRGNEMHFKYPNGDIYYEYEKEAENIEDWFSTREEAETYIEELKKLRKDK
jgi:hypothetical protein